MTRLAQLIASHQAKVTEINNIRSKSTDQLTEAELTRAAELVTEANKLAEDIDAEREYERRSAAVSTVAAELQTSGQQASGGQQPVTGEGTRSVQVDKDGNLIGVVGADGKPVSGTTTKDRDPGHYRSAKDGGRHSYFHDVFAIRQNGAGAEPDANKRLEEHTRAWLADGHEHYRAVVSSGANSGGAGLVVPHWLVDEYAAIARQGRKLANAVRNISLGGDPRPLTLPKQVAGTDANVTQQTTEGQNNGVAGTTADWTVTNTGWGTDAFETGVDTVTPKPFGGFQDVSRQFLDMATPAGDQLIYADLQSVFDFKIETLVGNTMIAAAYNPASLQFAAEADFLTPDGTGSIPTDAIIDATVAVYVGRTMNPDILVATPGRVGKFRKLKDSNGRPVYPVSDYGVMNGVGVAQRDPMVIDIEGLSGMGTLGIGNGTSGTYPEYILVARSTDTVLFTDDVMQFRFEEVKGPADIRMGIWSYAACVTRYVQSGQAGTVAIKIAGA